MNDIVSRRDLLKLTKGMSSFPDIAASHIYKAQRKNAQEAHAYMQALVPKDKLVTQGNTVATAYVREADGTIGFAMTTQRKNANNALVDKDERIKAILFANETDFFYGVWNLNKKRWRGRMRRAMTKGAREMAGQIK